MKINSVYKTPIPFEVQPRGATLTEVLIAIGIMGIGLIGVISLFPAAVMRSVHGNTLTVGTTLRFNAESMLRIHPELLLDPDRGDLNGNGLRYDDHAFSNFMVDPLGVANQPTVPDGSQIAGTGTIRRYTAGYSLANQASMTATENLFSGLDQWIVQYEEIPASGDLDPNSNPQSFNFTRLATRQVYVGPGLAPTRMVVFNVAGTGCQIRDLPPPAAVTTLSNTITWNNSPLPGTYSHPTFTSADIGNVRIEQRDLRFTWLMTAHGKTAGPVSRASELTYDVEIVVFYNRGYPPGDITGYGNTNAPNLVFQKDQATALVTWTGAGNAPFLKRGSFVLDAQNGFWYRIENYVESSTNATITLATPARANSQTAIFMKGIVDVFWIRQVTIPNPLK